NPAKLNRTLAKEYPDLKKISIDYALLEHAQNVLVADGAFEWDDLGSWTALGKHLKADAEGNCAVADFIHVDAARNIIFDARTKARRTPIAVVVLRGVVVLDEDRVAQADDCIRRPACFGTRIENDVPGCIDMDEVGDGAVAFGIGLEMLAQRGPRTQVVPFECSVRHDHILRVFQQRVINRDFS